MADLSIFNDLSEWVSIRLNSFQEESHDGDWIEHKTHTDYDLWLIRSGTVRVQVEGAEFAAAPGDVVFFYPQVSYRASTDPEGCRFYYVHFDYGIGGQPRILDDFPLSGIVPADRIREEFDWFAKAFAKSAAPGGVPGSRLQLKAGLTAAVAKIIELHGQGLYVGAFLNGSVPRRSANHLDVLQPIFKYVYDHLHRSVRMSELAALAGISEKYFISYFKKAIGITPGQYIQQIKMNRARDYLYERKYSVQQIAGFLGYPDPFTFSKAFKKYYNVPPSRFV